MTKCSACARDVPDGLRGCPLCGANVMDNSRGRLASPGKRLAAHFLDAAIPLLALAVSCGVGGGAAAAGAAGGSGGGVGIGIVLALAMLAAYAVWAFKLFATGVTPGKKALGMRVIRQDGTAAGLGTMIAREWATLTAKAPSAAGAEIES